MHRHLFFIGNFPIYTYGVMLTLAILSGMYLAVLRRRRLGLSTDDTMSVVSLAAISGLVGGRVLYLLQNLAEYRQHPLAIFNFREGGLDLYGAIVGLLLSLVWFSRRRGVPLSALFDVAGAVGIVCQAVGRIGCFFNGCCYGKCTTALWGVIFKDAPPDRIDGHDVDVAGCYRYPTQIYEMLGDMAIFAILCWFERRQRFRGQIFGIYLLLYAVLRFWMEFWREEPVVGGDMTFAQWCSIVAVPLGVAWLLWQRQRHAPVLDREPGQEPES